MLGAKAIMTRKCRTGTLLNGQPFQGEMVLRHGDRLQIGPLVFQLSLGRSEAEAAPLSSGEQTGTERHWEPLLSFSAAFARIHARFVAPISIVKPTSSGARITIMAS
jgi:predicted component of type VI protein secretion system